MTLTKEMLCGKFKQRKGNAPYSVKFTLTGCDKIPVLLL